MRTSRKIFVELKLKLMDKQDLGALLQGKIFKIPDYQRGYAWEEKQLKDLIEDIDSLAADETNEDSLCRNDSNLFKK